MRILLLLFVLPTMLIGQESFDVKWSEKTVENSTYKDMVKFQDAIYLLRNHNSGALVQNKDKTAIRKYDLNMKLLKEQKFSASVNGNKSVAFKILKTKDKLWIVTTDEAHSGKFLSISQLNSDLTMDENSAISFEIDYTTVLKKGATFHIDQSDNNSFTSICIPLKKKSGKNLEYKFFLLDESMQKVREGTFEIPDAKNKRTLKDMVVTNTGNIIGVSLRKVGTERFIHTWQYVFSSEESQVKELKQVAKKTIVAIGVSTKGNDVLISGGYSHKPNKENISNIRGVFSTTFNSGQTIPEINYTPLTPKVLHTVHPPMKQKKGLKKGEVYEFLRFAFGEGSLWNDDFIVINGERQYDVSGGDHEFGREIHVGCGFVVCLNKNGDLIWETPVIKHHEANNYYAIQGQKMLTTTDGILVIFNNFRGDVNGQKPLFPIAESSLITKIDEAGNSKTEVFFEKQTPGVLACPNWIKQVSDNQILIYGSALVQTRLGIWNIEN